MSRRLRGMRRALSRHRRAVAAVLAAVAALSLLAATRPAAPPTVAVLAAAQDLDGGAALGAGDVRTVALPPDVVPEGVLPARAQVDGRVLASAVRQGEVLTDLAFVGPALLRSYRADGLVAVPLRLADPAAARLLAPGALVDVLAATPTDAALTDPADPERSPPAEPARTVASRVRVLTVPKTESEQGLMAGEPTDGVLVLVAAPPAVAADLAGAEAGARLSVVLRPG